MAGRISRLEKLLEQDKYADLLRWLEQEEHAELRQEMILSARCKDQRDEVVNAYLSDTPAGFARMGEYLLGLEQTPNFKTGEPEYHHRRADGRFLFDRF